MASDLRPSAAGLRKAAVLLLQMGKEGSAKLMARLRESEVEALSAEILWGGREGWLLTAIGDDHGVVIVAPTGRGWIPVGLPARPLPTTIVAVARRSRELTLPEGPYRIRAVAER